MYPFHSTDIFVPGNCKSVGKQILRVVLHQLSTSRICVQLFDTRMRKDDCFWRVIVESLNDFPELSPVYLIQLLLEVSLSLRTS